MAEILLVHEMNPHCKTIPIDVAGHTLNLREKLPQNYTKILSISNGSNLSFILNIINLKMYTLSRHLNFI